MELRFYKITDAPEVVYKTLRDEHIIQGNLNSSIDMFSPGITIGEDIKDYNYLYIPEFKKYYFISGCNIVTNDLFELKDVKEDVLMTLKSEFVSIPCIIDKVENKNIGDEFIDDGSFITSSKTINQVYNFPNGFNDTPEFILLTAGGLSQ